MRSIARGLVTLVAGGSAGDSKQSLHTVEGELGGRFRYQAPICMCILCTKPDRTKEPAIQDKKTSWLQLYRHNHINMMSSIWGSPAQRASIKPPLIIPKPRENKKTRLLVGLGFLFIHLRRATVRLVRSLAFNHFAGGGTLAIGSPNFIAPVIINAQMSR